MLLAVGSLAVMGVALGGILGAAARFLAVEENPLEEELKAMLPGSQCGQCGFVGCGQAAAALARGEAPVTLCPPGGKAVVEALAKKLGVTADLSEHEEKLPEHAYIIEDLCIGCTRCIRECSVDAILGANKLMHAVITDVCHGCKKCVPVCPTDAIIMKPIEVTVGTWHWSKPEAAQPVVH
ncbi:MAG: RnfABCDGE type electron transport complex subunit B [Thiothrix sp.]|jgi:electron transport complex protein RnfB|uniref:RnfABCDGE type electron transport complex subunit B n=1 Tax=Thiothrix sp. TaxID=1032 RepID=UPI002638B390|nr:RnfABCDGE type electron transport complex subunit B [Thiothrix sp.]MDD5394489.1 RnfABCDGE type electron transport complex subunit B [Thiothrix sp.]